VRDKKPAEAVRMRLDLAPADRDRVRIAAAKAGLDMASFLRRVVLERLGEIERAESYAAIGRAE
jgi:hypothetical protein